MSIRMAIANGVITKLKEILPNCQTYVSGSVSIGLDIDSSEIDIALHDSTMPISIVESRVCSFGFRKNNSNSTYNHHLFEWKNIHIILYSSESEFKADQRTHEKINNLFSNVPEIMELCIMLKEKYNVKGGNIFKCFNKILNK